MYNFVSCKSEQGKAYMLRFFSNQNSEKIQNVLLLKIKKRTFQNWYNSSVHVRPPTRRCTARPVKKHFPGSCDFKRISPVKIRVSRRNSWNLCERNAFLRGMSRFVNLMRRRAITRVWLWNELRFRSIRRCDGGGRGRRGRVCAGAVWFPARVHILLYWLWWRWLCRQNGFVCAGMRCTFCHLYPLAAVN